MTYLQQEIEENMYQQKKLLEKYTNEFKKLPEGRLICCKTAGKSRYYHAVQLDGKYVRKSIDRNIDMQKKLARKEFLLQVCNALSNNVNNMEKCVAQICPIDFDSIVREMPKAFQNLPEDYFVNKNEWAIDFHTDDEFSERLARHKAWGNAEYERSDYKSEYLKHMTSMGFKVRSKSELIIAEQLNAYGVPFHYEEIIRKDDMSFIPDFTFEDSEGNLFYWEHAGMMELEDYASRHKSKMEFYRQFGIVPWDNLIITYDKMGDINLPIIKATIEYDVIPRL